MQFIEVLTSDGIVEVVLNRPKVNAMNQAMLREITDVFRRLAEDDSVRGVLVRGAGQCLSAGLDIREVASLDRAGLTSFLDDFDAAFSAAFRFPKPFAAAVHGHAIAGGIVLAMCADFIALGAGDHKIGLTELAVGVPFPPVVVQVVRSAGPTRALRRLVFGAELHTPAEIFEMGVGDALSDEPLEDTRRFLTKACSRPAATCRLSKASYRKGAWARLAPLPPAERDVMADAMLSAEQVGRAVAARLLDQLPEARPLGLQAPAPASAPSCRGSEPRRPASRRARVGSRRPVAGQQISQKPARSPGERRGQGLLARSSITETALRLGFSDTTALRHVFRRWFGCPPREPRGARGPRVST